MVLIIRLVLSSLLMWQVWEHSHWSIALSLTLMLLKFELDYWIDRQRAAEFDALGRKYFPKSFPPK
jgi:hypothetical protein